MLIQLLVLGSITAYGPISARAEDEAADVNSAEAEADVDASTDDGLQYLRPELEGSATKLGAGRRQFLRRVSFSPGYGRLGEQEYFVFRFAYNPNSWLGWEVGLGHNPAHSVHGVLHNLSAVLRYPVPFRIQPYVNLGYGMLTIYPGQTINADPVTKNTFTYGTGLEIYLRDDVAVRGELLGASVIGSDPTGIGNSSYTYREFTFGFSFYRSLGQ
jgi:hypothetical protein